MIHKTNTYNDIIHFICYSGILPYKPWVGEMPTALDKKQKSSKQSYGEVLYCTTYSDFTLQMFFR